MKANKKFIEEDEAVSAVIGVILMVAITVAIAATVYYYVTVMMPSGSETAPTFQLRTDDLEDRLIVTSADTGADWNRLAIKASKGSTDCLDAVPTVLFSLNTDVTLAAAPTVPADATAWQAGPGAETAVGFPISTTIAVEIEDAQNLMSATEYLDLEGYNYVGAAGIIVPEVSVTLLDTTANQEIGTYSFTSIVAAAT